MQGEAVSLTKIQKGFLADLFEDSGYPLVECHSHEWRTAKSLEARGLIKITGERSEFGTFEAQGLPAGRAALQETPDAR